MSLWSDVFQKLLVYCLSQVGVRTALPIHFNQKCRGGNLSHRNGEVEKEDCDPGEKKKVMEFALFLDDSYMVSETV